MFGAHDWKKKSDRNIFLGFFQTAPQTINCFYGDLCRRRLCTRETTEIAFEDSSTVYSPRWLGQNMPSHERYFRKRLRSLHGTVELFALTIYMINKHP